MLTKETAGLLFANKILSGLPTWYILEIPYGVLGKGIKGWGKVCVILICHPYQDLWWEDSLLYNWYVTTHSHKKFIFPGKSHCRQDIMQYNSQVFFCQLFLGAVPFRIQSALTRNNQFSINQFIFSVSVKSLLYFLPVCHWRRPIPRYCWHEEMRTSWRSHRSGDTCYQLSKWWNTVKITTTRHFWQSYSLVICSLINISHTKSKSHCNKKPRYTGNKKQPVSYLLQTYIQNTVNVLPQKYYTRIHCLTLSSHYLKLTGI